MHCNLSAASRQPPAASRQPPAASRQRVVRWHIPHKIPTRARTNILICARLEANQAVPARCRSPHRRVSSALGSAPTQMLCQTLALGIPDSRIRMQRRIAGLAPTPHDSGAMRCNRRRSARTKTCPFTCRTGRSLEQPHPEGNRTSPQNTRKTLQAGHSRYRTQAGYNRKRHPQNRHPLAPLTR